MDVHSRCKGVLDNLTFAPYLIYTDLDSDVCDCDACIQQ